MFLRFISGILFQSILFPLQLFPQLLSVQGSGDLTILPATDFAFDQLVINPSSVYTISNNSLSLQYKSMLPNGSSIAKSYIFDYPAPSFSGKLFFGYRNENLSGLSVNQLNIQVFDNSIWTSLNSTRADNYWKLIESEEILNKPLKTITLGQKDIINDFDVINYRLGNTSAKVSIHQATTLYLHSLDGKLLFSHFFPIGIHEINMNRFAKSIYILSSNYTFQKINN